MFLRPERPGFAVKRAAFKGKGFKVKGFKVKGFKVKGFKVKGFKVKGFKVKSHFVLPEGSPSRADSRPGPAPALSASFIAALRCPRYFSLPDGPLATRPPWRGASLSPTSCRLVLERFIHSALKWPPTPLAARIVLNVTNNWLKKPWLDETL
ncbi:hypothetical protein J8I88_05400 [Duffyella gerundensis]|uniref:hypothetical protein n=1 Tax=Duffyella gerundensis TaxID=1619313 RepID=UPI001AE38211|nr:hypothetical protein [Duffyella gerundensis]QTO55299.1 hypothetical protein J8I88_05400 [Duffyella gerundensis]